MGTLRFLLACTVMASHLDVRLFGLTPGVIAVVVFYLLAGHVVAGLWSKYQLYPNGLRLFYVDRAWRILPQYIAALLLSVTVWHSGAQSPFLSAQPDITDWVANVLIIPLNFYMYTGQDSFTLIPPAWSLGTEIQFYLLAPLLLSQKHSVVLGVFVISFGIFLLAQCQLIAVDYYGYRLIPGILFIFLLGSLLRITQHDKLSHQLMVCFWLGHCVYLLCLLLQKKYTPYNQEVVIGLLIGLPLLYRLAKPWFADKPILKTFDRRLGELSYGIFLYHFPIMWLVKLHFAYLSSDIFPVFSLSIGCAAIGHWLLERPVWRCVRPVLTGIAMP